MSPIVSEGTSSGFFSRITRSASFPGSRVPFVFSSLISYAAIAVTARSAA